MSLIYHDYIIFRLDRSASGAVPLFKGPEGTQISTAELRRIKVDIRRNIPAKGQVTELQRDILNPEDVILKRREGKTLYSPWHSFVKDVSLNDNGTPLSSSYTTF
ncbi:hypothetical protein EAI_07167 [Harpegnathos saltator]|uniref:Complementary sex determination N-terminal domain-containing protein n=1 Tax=Harpegnathos saltator TaxID=610380 RepID=E2C627_HARSA|nr:hypothetical protein EAI_07167 [Harpegnathos saltator]